jgi:hypothetical protein
MSSFGYLEMLINVLKSQVLDVYTAWRSIKMLSIVSTECIYTHVPHMTLTMNAYCLSREH